MTENRTKKHSCFDWTQLFISFSIPIAISIYTILENNRELAISSSNRAHDLKMAENQQHDAILHDYQKTLGKLLEKYGPQLNQSLAISLVARFATLSALNQLDPARRSFLIRLLYNAKLITYNSTHRQPTILLESANLTDLCLFDETTKQSYFGLSMAGTIMIRANFHSIYFEGAVFTKAILRNADFSSTENVMLYEDTDVSQSNSISLDFEQSDLTYVSFDNAMYKQVSFKEAAMMKTNFYALQCFYCAFYSANMSRTILRNVDIQHSSFAFAILRDAEIYKSILFLNVEFDNAVLEFADIGYNKFTECEFDSAKLKSTKFHYNTMVNSTFVRANMVFMSILYNTFINVDFTYTNMTGSSWRHNRCERCNFNNVVFSDIDLTDSIFINSDFRNSTISKDQLNQATSLTGSILPYGVVIS